jgi:predicted site-specific integrase-resolvase
MSETTSKVTMTEREFCEAVGISRVTCWRLRESGKLAYLRIGGKIKYTPRIVEEFLASCERVVKTLKTK